MPLTKLTTDVKNIEKLSDRPNADDGLTPAQLKAEFDNGPQAIKDYINDTLTTEVDTHIANISNPHTVTKTQVGLSNVDNTNDLDKPISTATQNALNSKANDNAVVKLTGNQTIDDTKTFTSNVVIPETPTLDAHATSKGYVDDEIAGVVLGQILDGSLTDVKLSDSAGQIKDRVSTNTTDIAGIKDEVPENKQSHFLNEMEVDITSPGVTQVIKVFMEEDKYVDADRYIINGIMKDAQAMEDPSTTTTTIGVYSKDGLTELLAPVTYTGAWIPDETILQLFRTTTEITTKELLDEWFGSQTAYDNLTIAYSSVRYNVEE